VSGRNPVVTALSRECGAKIGGPVVIHPKNEQSATKHNVSQKSRRNRTVGQNEAGPIFAVELPLFDWGQARREVARMQIMELRDRFTALAIRIRSLARLQQAKLLNARQIALRDLPLNGMFRGRQVLKPKPKRERPSI
jgi:hypothetical protein